MTQENGIKRRFIGALDLAMQQGFSKWAVLTHAWLESDAFRRVIGQFNFWGIKKPKNWLGKVVLVDTHEYIDGAKVPVKDVPFIDFISIEDAIIWYCSFIRRIYPNAYENRFNPIDYFAGLVSGELKYCTDPNYPTKLASLYEVLKKDSDIVYLVAIGQGTQFT